VIEEATFTDATAHRGRFSADRRLGVERCEIGETAAVITIQDAGSRVF